MATKIRASNLHTDVKTMVTTMVSENALDSAEANLLIDSKFTAKIQITYQKVLLIFILRMLEQTQELK